VPVKIVIDGPRDALAMLGPGMSVDPRVHVR
jgi:multidrug resistance efflux pump